MDIKIKREPGRFFASMEGNESYLLYAVIDSIVDIKEVFVHKGHRGHGIAAELCEAAFLFAKEKNCKVAPTCPYVKEKFLPEHKEWKGAVTEKKPFYLAKKK